MTPERLEHIRNAWLNERPVPYRAELLALVDQLTSELEQHADTIERLTGERDRARDLCVRTGVFEDGGGKVYALTPEEL